MSRDDEQVWAELVESFNTPADEEHAWPAAEDVDPQASDDDSVAPDEPADPDGAGVTGPRDSDDSHGAVADPEEHFVPPAPPPLPSTDLITRLAWAGALGTPILFTAAALLGVSISGWAAVLGGAAFIGGFALLVARLKGHDPYDPDDGAVV